MTNIESWTGERLETFVYNENTNEHLHRYALAMQLVRGKRVLDIACGEGYGSALMAGIAASVMGVDIDAATIARAKEKYTGNSITFLTGSVDAIPCADAGMDVIISFETIEHHNRHKEMMQEIKRVLAPGGILLISSPDKLNYSEKPGFTNPFHVKELYRAEFETLINTYFTHTLFMGQRSFYGSMIAPITANQPTAALSVYKGSYETVSRLEMEPVYIIGLASDGPLPEFNASVLDGAEVLKMQYEAFRIEVTKDAVAVITKEIRSSLSFRLGYFILSPLRLIKHLLHG